MVLMFSDQIGLAGDAIAAGGGEEAARSDLPLHLRLRLSRCRQSRLDPQKLQNHRHPRLHHQPSAPRTDAPLATNIAQELTSRTKYNIVADPNQADAVLKGSLSNFVVLSDHLRSSHRPRDRGTVVATLQITLTERATGKVLFSRPSLELRERYEISTDPQTYFDESGAAVERVARDAARTVVTSILENF